MALRVSGKNLDVGEALRSQVESRVRSALGKYFDGDYSGHVTVAKDGAGFRTECVLHLTSGITLEASGAAPDAYLSFDQTAERIEKRLRRYKRRLKDRQATSVRTGRSTAPTPCSNRPATMLPKTSTILSSSPRRRARSTGSRSATRCSSSISPARRWWSSTTPARAG